MLEITGESISFLNSCIGEIIVSTITLVLFFIAIAIKTNNNIREVRKNKSTLLTMLDCIKNQKDPEKLKTLKILINENVHLLNYVHGPIGNTPFLVACEHGASEIVQEMLKLGANIKYTNIEGNGPLYLAVYYLSRNIELKDATLIRTLFYCGCDINIKNKKGFTPLHLAAYYGHVPLIRWLISKGANTEILPLSSGIALANGKRAAAYLLYMQQYNKKTEPPNIAIDSQ